jgi:anti-sigma-K factor RskA
MFKMKTTGAKGKLNTLTKTLFLGVLATMIIFSFHSCAKKASFLISSVVPAARGEVTVTTDKNNNYVIKMQISNLAEVDRLQPAKKSYVVWMEAEQGLTRNIGLITSSTKLKVSFETVATLRPTRIFITAEEDEGVQYPGSMVVLTTGRL